MKQQAEPMSIEDMANDKDHPLHEQALMAKRVGDALQFAGIKPHEAVFGMVMIMEAFAAIALPKAGHGPDCDCGNDEPEPNWQT